MSYGDIFFLSINQNAFQYFNIQRPVGTILSSSLKLWMIPRKNYNQKNWIENLFLSNRSCTKEPRAIPRKPMHWNRVSTTSTSTSTRPNTSPVTNWPSPTSLCWLPWPTWRASTGPTNPTIESNAGPPNSKPNCLTTTSATLPASPCSRSGSKIARRQPKLPPPPRPARPRVRIPRPSFHYSPLDDVHCRVVYFFTARCHNKKPTNQAVIHFYPCSSHFCR